MATIVYTRTKHQPEVLYLPLEHGGFIMLQEGAHQYPEHAGHGLKNSSNIVVQQYIKTGQLTVQLDNNPDTINIDFGSESVRQFAPFSNNDNYGIRPKKIAYANLNQSSNAQVTVSNDEPLEEESNKRTRK